VLEYDSSLGDGKRWGIKASDGILSIFARQMRDPFDLHKRFQCALATAMKLTRWTATLLSSASVRKVKTSFLLW
jgi:hypothetical protein